MPRPRSPSGPHDHKDELRLWLRLFTCKELIEGEVRRRLRDSFDVTLPRFDLMAQLDRTPERHDARRAVAAHDGHPTATSPAWSTGWSSRA